METPKPNQDPKISTDNIFDNLLQKTKNEKSKSAVEESKIVSGVIDQKDSKILGQLPQKHDLTMMRLIKQGKKLSFGWTLLKVVLVFGVISFCYFYYELTPSINQLEGVLGKPNSINQLSKEKNEFVQQQAKINANNTMAVMLNIDNLTYLSDSYFFYKNKLKPIIPAKTNATTPKSPVKIQSAKEQEEFQKGKENIITTMEFIQDRLKKPFLPASLDPKEALKTELNPLILEETKKQIREFKNKEKANIYLGAKTFDGAIRLLSKPALIESFKKFDLASMKSSFLGEAKDKESLIKTEDDLQKLIKDMNQVAQNDFSLVSKIRDSRMPWVNLIDNIDTLTKDVDDYYTTKNLRQVFYTSYNFNSKDKKLSITGTIRKLDPYNFSMLAKVIETFEKSKIFSDVSIGSFSKTKQGKYWTSPLNLNFTIQDQEGCDPRDYVYSMKDYIDNYKEKGEDFKNDCQSVK